MSRRGLGTQNPVSFLGGTAVACLALGCMEMPPPADVEDLSGLERRYENPTATLPDKLALRVLESSGDSSALTQQLAGLHVIHAAVTSAAKRLAQQDDADAVDLQGTIEVEHACPGYGDEPATSVEVGGAIYLTLNVRDSYVLRGAAGLAVGCRFKVDAGDMGTRVELDSSLAIDLGADTRIGAKIESMLMVRLRDIEAHIRQDAPPGLVLNYDKYDFRVSHERIETLIDMSTLALGLPSFGTTVFIASRDGSFSLRERRGEWLCDRVEDSCELIR
jgi:hypothetical protein